MKCPLSHNGSDCGASCAWYLIMEKTCGLMFLLDKIRVHLKRIEEVLGEKDDRES